MLHEFIPMLGYDINAYSRDCTGITQTQKSKSPLVAGFSILSWLGKPECKWWRGPESNWGHEDFQSTALPTELPRPKAKRMLLNSSSSVNTFFKVRTVLLNRLC